MFKKAILINIGLVAFYFSTDKLFTVEEREMLMYFIILVVILSMTLAPSFTAKEQKERGELIDREWQEGEYHNDFSRVPNAENARAVKPIDLSGDAIANARKSLHEDLKQIGLVNENSSDIADESKE